MKHVIATDRPIHRLYDLKGSTRNRRTRPNDTKMNATKAAVAVAPAPIDDDTPVPIWKDLDFIEDGIRLHLPSDIRDAFVAQLERDSAVCDLLFGIVVASSNDVRFVFGEWHFSCYHG
jgi:hypothetical protein